MKFTFSNLYCFLLQKKDQVVITVKQKETFCVSQRRTWGLLSCFILSQPLLFSILFLLTEINLFPPEFLDQLYTRPGLTSGSLRLHFPVSKIRKNDPDLPRKVLKDLQKSHILQFENSVFGLYRCSVVFLQVFARPPCRGQDEDFTLRLMGDKLPPLRSFPENTFSFTSFNCPSNLYFKVYL